jgi:hypothetical protein
MNAGMVLLGAETCAAVINVVAPAAMGETIFFTDATANRAGFAKIGDNVAGNVSPVFHHLAFFPNPGQVVFAHHTTPPGLSLYFDANKGPNGTENLENTFGRITPLF